MAFEIENGWIRPILPSNFISLAEENGLIDDLIDDLTAQICQKAFLKPHVLSGELTLAVNVSPIQMRNTDLPSQIQKLAEAAKFSLPRLIIEVTESALHHDLKRARQVAGDLKAMGCKLALDDFGTGYSNLQHSQSLNFDELKIDRSFVSGRGSPRFAPSGEIMRWYGSVEDIHDEKLQLETAGAGE